MSTPAPPVTSLPGASLPATDGPEGPETPPQAAPPLTVIEQLILALAAARGTDKSICPSEVARALLPGSSQARWQSLMTPVRQAAIRLVAAGRIDVLRKGKPVTTSEVKGVIRLRLRNPPAQPASPTLLPSPPQQ